MARIQAYTHSTLRYLKNKESVWAGLIALPGSINRLKMKKRLDIQLWGILSVAFLSVCSCDRTDDTDSFMPSSGRPITFTAMESPLWPDLTKGPVESVSDLLGDGFCIWGSWIKDPLDKVIYGEDYYLEGQNGAVFGQSGSVVTATDENGDEKFDQDDDSWTYAPQQEWYRGYYSFAAVLPASALSEDSISGRHYSHAEASTEFTYTSGTMTGVTYNNRLTLDFPNDRFVLGGMSVSGTRLPESSQPDLMYALSEVDNSANKADDVSLEFVHTCSRLSISVSVNDPSKTMSIQRITLYGILNSIPTPLEFTRTVQIEEYGTESPTENVTHTENFTSRLAQAAMDSDEYRSTQSSPFAVFNRPEGDGEDAVLWDVRGSDPDKPSAVRLVEDLIVFPGTLSTDNQLTIKVEYISGEDLLTTFVKLSSGEWLPGKNYAYVFQADYAS